VNQSLTVDVTAIKWNDSDPDGIDVTVIEIRNDASYGTAQASLEDGKIRRITYTPNPDFQGEDRFTYVIVDAGGLRAVGTVIIQVIAAQQETPPSAP
jgi:hypothetical protein